MTKKHLGYFLLLLLVCPSTWAIPSTMEEADRIFRTLRETTYRHDLFIDD